MMMDHSINSDCDVDSDEKEDWMDTHWDVVQDCSSSKTSDCSKDDCVNASRERPEEGNAPLMSRMQLNDHKAGMQGLDKEHINQIIFEVSKGSPFFENERRKEEQVQHRIQEQERHRRSISESELQKGKSEADSLIFQLNLTRDLTQTIVHVDMDAFYAAVEMRENPSLRNKPMAVGGIGMLSTSNYEARKFGVRAAMPGFIGKKLCPQLTIVPTNFQKYREVSEQVRLIFADYDKHFCPMSLDEAYLNFTEHIQKRQAMSATDRLYLKRRQTPPEPESCQCNLNTTVRQSVLKSESQTKSNSDITLNNEDRYQCAGDKNYTKDVLENVTHVDENSPSSAGNCSALIQNEDRLVEKPSDPDRFNGIPAIVGSKCPSCDKAIPQFEIVTFDVDVESAVNEMRCRIEQQTCLTASAGIAPNMMLAKVCSDQNKPNGQFFLPANYEDIMHFVQQLPIRKISGIGRVTEQLLGSLGISSCSDLLEKRALLYHLYSPVSFSYFMRVACGIGSTQVARARDEERKSMSTEQTFGELSRPEELYSKCEELCQSIAEDLVKEQLVGKCVSLKLKTTDFQVRTRAQTISNYTGNADVIFKVAKGILRAEILAEAPKPLRLRLMGVRISKLINESECPKEKQDTIFGFFKKASASSSAVTGLTPVQSVSNLSPDAKHKSCMPETSVGSSLLSSGVNETEKEAASTAKKFSPFSKFVIESGHSSQSEMQSSDDDSRGSIQSMVNFRLDEGRTNRQMVIKSNIATKAENVSTSRAEDVNTSSDTEDGCSFVDYSMPECRVKEPNFTCPVCFKIVGCNGLTDFNAHIDKCLQSESQQSSNSEKNLAGENAMNSVNHFVSQQPATQKSQASQNSSKDSVRAETSSYGQKQNHESANSGSIKINSCDTVSRNIAEAINSVSNSSELLGIGPNSTNRTLFDLDQSEMKETVTAHPTSQQQNINCANTVSTEYMRCPVCSAERADWTLTTFNQHVDTCLNRDTISQILSEQRASEKPPQKRSASNQLKDNRDYQQRKRAKKSQSPKPASSILSFLKN